MSCREGGRGGAREGGGGTRHESESECLTESEGRRAIKVRMLYKEGEEDRRVERNTDGEEEREKVGVERRGNGRRER